MVPACFASKCSSLDANRFEHRTTCGGASGFDQSQILFISKLQVIDWNLPRQIAVSTKDVRQSLFNDPLACLEYQTPNYTESRREI